MSVDPEALEARLPNGELRAERLARLWRLVEGYTDPREAWEALASDGACPLAWASDEHRGFALDGRRAYFPPTVLACVTVALDPWRMQTAEALARELTARLDDPRERVLWQFVAPRNPLRGASGVPYDQWLRAWFPLPDYAVEAREAAYAGALSMVEELGRAGTPMVEVRPREVVLEVSLASLA